MKQRAYYEQDGHFTDGRERFRFWVESDSPDRFSFLNTAELDARKKEYDCWPSIQQED